jgi:hypothetical protein
MRGQLSVQGSGIVWLWGEPDALPIALSEIIRQPQATVRGDQ